MHVWRRRGRQAGVGADVETGRQARERRRQKEQINLRKGWVVVVVMVMKEEQEEEEAGGGDGGREGGLHR